MNGPTTSRNDGVNGSAARSSHRQQHDRDLDIHRSDVGESYQLAATWPGSYQSYGYADYIATDAAGPRDGRQHSGTGQRAPASSPFALPSGYAQIGNFIATSSTSPCR